MSVSLDQFTQQVVAIGLLTVGEVDDLLQRLPAGQPNAEHAQAFARWLVKEKKLTPFQAQQIYAGKGKALVLGNYVILDKLGQGGMGMVYRAHHRLMKREVALKVLPPMVSKDPQAIKRFHREVEAVARLNHPNIVSAFDADQTGSTLYLIMEYVAGRDLAVVVREQGPANVEQAVDFILQAARGLECAHAHGVIHRDIKPANLLLDKSGTVKILDMGLARFESDQADSARQGELTGTGTIMGTVDYMSPEQAGDTKSAGAQADIYSLGASLFFLLTGKSMVPAETLGKKIYALMSGKGIAQSIRELRPEVPENLDAVFRRMTARALSNRYASIPELITDLEAIQAGTIPNMAIGVKAMRAELSVQDHFESFLHSLETSPGTAPQTIIQNPSADLRDDFSFGAPAAEISPEKKQRHPIPAKNLTRRTFGIVAAILFLILLSGLWLNSGNVGSPGQVVQGDRVQRQQPRSTSGASSGRSQVGSASNMVNFALEFDGENDYVAIPSLKIPTGSAVTLEVWFEPFAHQSSANILTWLGPNQLSLYQSDSAFGLARKWGGRSIVQRESSGRWHAGERFHLAVIWREDQYKMYVNGDAVSTIDVDYKLKDPAGEGLYVGGFPPELLEGETRFILGTVDEIHISKTARYSADFVPAARFTPDSQTLALYHCDEGTGDQLTDASGNRHHGRIMGARWIRVVETPAAPYSSD